MSEPRTMTLWRFPDPWDYHQRGAYVVAAESREAAVAILEAEAERTEAERAAWERRKQAVITEIGLPQPPDFRTPEWKALSAWFTANPAPSVVSLPDGYRERAEAAGLVYADGGCDD